jgi:hypothetical protein
MSLRRPASLAGAVALAIAVAPASATAGNRGSPSPATVAARAGLVRRADLGRGWSQTNVAPHSAAALTCATDRAIGASLASATWASSDTTEFLSGTSYGFSGRVQQQRAWRTTSTAAMGRCLKRQFAESSSHGVALVATGVRRVSAPRWRGAPPGASLRAYLVAGTASGAGQQLGVTLEVVLVGDGAWIGEDELSTEGGSAPPGVLGRAAASQARRAAAAPA